MRGCKRGQPRPPDTSAPPAVVIGRAVLAVVAAAAALTGVAIVAQDSLPTLVTGTNTFAATASALTAFPLALSILAVVVVWRRRTSVLDEWLLVALIAAVAETGLVVLLGGSRYTFPFYATRPLAVKNIFVSDSVEIVITA